MSKAGRPRTAGPFRTWAGDSVPRRFVVWLIRGATTLGMLAIGVAIILPLLVPNMIDGLTPVFRR